FMAVLTLYCSIIIYMYTPGFKANLEQISNSMGETFSAFGMSDFGTNLIQFMASYLYGFILIAFPMVFIIIISSRLMVKYVDKTSASYLLSSPHKRVSIATNQGLFFIFSIFLLFFYVFILSVCVCQVMFKDELNIEKFIVLNLGLLSLMIFLSGLCFMFSFALNESKTATGLSSAFLIGFLLIKMLSETGDKITWLKYLTPLTLFNPKKIIEYDTLSIVCFLILLVFGLLFYFLGILIFTKKDIHT
ncbi:MAG: ABC transporter permease, partial [Oscillospiraceae bacterium]